MKFTFPPEAKPLDGYTIKRGIHRGGFGEVYYALSDAGKEVALKLLQNNSEVELRGVQQCLNLKHSNLVTIFDIRRDNDGDHWIVMEYVTGRSLDRLVAEHPQGMPINLVQELLSGIADGLTYLHARGIVHRDLKPANVYLEQNQIKIGDVGLSKFISDSRRSAQTQSVGTVYYMAPEVAKGRYGREIDVYALGIMLYEMLTGRVPFDGETAGEILMKHLSEKPDLRPLPSELRPVLARALEKDPLKRTPDASKLVSEFFDAIVPRNGARNAGRPSSSSSRDAQHRHTRPCRASVQPRGEAPWGAHGVLGKWPQGTNGLLLAVAVLFVMLLIAETPLALGVIGLMMVGGMFAAFGFATYKIVGMLTGAAVPGMAHPLAESQPYEHSPPSMPQSPAAPHPAYKQRPVEVRRHLPAELTPATIRNVTWRNRMTELSGSLTFAALSTSVITAGLAILEFLPDPSAIGLFAVTTLLASWGLLTASKLWEGSDIDAVHRRIGLLGVGLLVGAAAYWVDQTVLMDWPYDHRSSPDALVTKVGSRPLFDGTHPTLAGYAVFFAGLFALRRWWWQADSFRSKRYRVSSALLTLAVGYLLTTVFQFPSDWGMLWAITISSVVQLSAVYVPPEQRRAQLEAPQHVT